MRVFNIRERRLVEELTAEPIQIKIQVENPSIKLTKTLVFSIFDDIDVEVSRNLKSNLYDSICKRY